jgi:hypothetical protein
MSPVESTEKRASEPPAARGADSGAGPGPVPGPGPGLRDSAWRAATFAFAASFVLHGLAVLWAWHAWGGFGRGGVLAWIDFPSSLAYLRLRGGAKLAWSLLVGGLQWGVVGAGLSLLVGSSARRPPAD